MELRGFQLTPAKANPTRGRVKRTNHLPVGRVESS